MIKTLIRFKKELKPDIRIEIENKLDEIFFREELNKAKIEDTVFYYGNNLSTDYGVFSAILIYLKNKDWFISNIDSWIWFNSDDGVTEEDYNIEDILEHYTGIPSKILENTKSYICKEEVLSLIEHEIRKNDLKKDAAVSEQYAWGFSQGMKWVSLDIENMQPKFDNTAELVKKQDILNILYNSRDLTEAIINVRGMISVI